MIPCAHLAAACLVLHAGDLPPGFVREQAEGSAASYRVAFARLTTATGLQEGPLAITSSAAVYPDAPTARLALRRSAPHGTAGLEVGYRLGDEAHEYVVQLGSAFGALLRYSLFWRDGRVDGSVSVTGRVGVVSSADLAPLARAQEARIASSVRPEAGRRTGAARPAPRRGSSRAAPAATGR
jgi:hypothetical protein